MKSQKDFPFVLLLLTPSYCCSLAFSRGERPPGESAKGHETKMTLCDGLATRPAPFPAPVARLLMHLLTWSLVLTPAATRPQHVTSLRTGTPPHLVHHYGPAIRNCARHKTGDE